MDKLKNYIREIEDQLNIEQISTGVWLDIHTQLQSKSATVRPIKRKHEQMRWLQWYKPVYLKWAFALLIPVFTIISCTYRIKSIETIGTIVVFKTEAANYSIIRQIYSMKDAYSFNMQEALNEQRSILSFVGFVKPQEAVKIHSIKKRLNNMGVANFIVMPLEKIKSESLFSRAAYKVFNKHVDLKQTRNEEIIDKISAQLLKRGIKNMSVQITEKEGVILISTGRTELSSDSKAGIKKRDTVFSKTPIPKSLDIVEKNVTESVSSDLGISHLRDFDWLLHTWRTKDSSQNSYHKWVRINNTMYKSFVLRLEPDSKIFAGYFLHSRGDEIVLAKGNRSWLFEEKAINAYVFQSELQQFPHQIRWDRTERIWWFRQITGSLKDETALYIDDSKNRQLDSVLNAYKIKNPSAFK
jgi:hypothetical protein